MEDLVNWLNKQIERRGWNYADVARYGGISQSMISRVVSGQSKPGLDFCNALARAFDERPEIIMRKAGLLPPLPPAVEEEEELVSIVRSLQPDAREIVLTQLRALAGRPPAYRLIGEDEPEYDSPAYDDEEEFDDDPEMLAMLQDIAERLVRLPEDLREQVSRDMLRYVETTGIAYESEPEDHVAELEEEKEGDKVDSKH